MGFKTFVADDPLTAAEVNTYLAKQAVVVCTEGTKPAAPPHGMVCTTTDTDRTYRYDGAAWEQIAGPLDWQTPTLQGSWAISAGDTVMYAKRDGLLYVRGLVTGGSFPSTIFQLAPGFRPATRQYRDTGQGGNQGRLTFNTNGEVKAETVGTDGTNWILAVAPIYLED